MNRPRYSESRILKALNAVGGRVELAAITLGCHRTTIYARAEKSERIARAIVTHNGGRDLLSDKRLLKAVRKGEAWAALAVLKSLGRTHGYTEHKLQTRRWSAWTSICPTDTSVAAQLKPEPIATTNPDPSHPALQLHDPSRCGTER